MLLPPPPHPLENWPELSEDLTLWDTGRKLKKMFSRHFRAQKTGSGPQVRGQTDGHTDRHSVFLAASPHPSTRKPPAHSLWHLRLRVLPLWAARAGVSWEQVSG